MVSRDWRRVKEGVEFGFGAAFGVLHRFPGLVFTKFAYRGVAALSFEKGGVASQFECARCELPNTQMATFET